MGVGRQFSYRTFAPIGQKRPRLREVGRIRAQLTKSKMLPEHKGTAFRFFRHHVYHPKPTPYEELTPLQKRMQCGGW